MPFLTLSSWQFISQKRVSNLSFVGERSTKYVLLLNTKSYALFLSFVTISIYLYLIQI